MIGLMLQVGGAGFSELLQELEGLGFFRYVLPFLLIFAVVYAVLTKIHVFKDNKGASVIIAVAIGLLSLQFDKVPAFFQVVFPNFGIGVSILLILLILAGAFISGDDTNKAYQWIFFGLGALIFLVIVFSSFSDYGFVGSWWWQRYGTLIIVALIIVGAIVGVIVSSTKGQNKNKNGD